jgi:hypothetical protein
MNIKKVIEFLLPSGLFFLIRKYFTLNFLNNFRKKFKYFCVRENSVLLIEFYSVHGESLPGHAKYFLDLGYNVDIIVQKQKKDYYLDRNDAGLFACFNNTDMVRVLTLSRRNMNFLLRSSAVKNYKHIMINTFANGMIYRDLFNVDLFNLKPICVKHNSDITDNYFKTNKIISHVRITSINFKPPVVVNPHYFCEIQKHEKSVKTVFSAVNARNLNRRNLFLLFNACDKLYEKGIYNFSVKILGNGISIPERYKNNLIDFGYVNFQSMYKEIMESDFLLALIDQASVQYSNKASGSYQLSYGFLKPIVLHRIFSVVSGFNDDNSILYDDNNHLADSMEKCITMQNNDYLSLVDTLEKSEKKLYDASLKNFKQVLESSV